MKALRIIPFLCALLTISTASAQKIEIPEWFFDNEEKTYIGVSMPGAPREQAVLCALLYMMSDSGEVAIDSIAEIRTRSDNGKEIFDMRNMDRWGGEGRYDYDIIHEERLDNGETAIAITPGDTYVCNVKFFTEYTLSHIDGREEWSVSMAMTSDNGSMWRYECCSADGIITMLKSAYSFANGKKYICTGDECGYSDSVKGLKQLHKTTSAEESDDGMQATVTQIAPCLGAALVEQLFSMPPPLLDATISSSSEFSAGKNIEESGITAVNKLPPTRFCNKAIYDNKLYSVIKTNR